MSDAPNDENLSAPMSDGGLGNRLRSAYAGRGPLLIAIGATVGSLALLCIFTLLLLTTDGSEQPTPTPPPIDQGEVDTDTFIYEAISESGAISLTLETPIFLNVAGEEYSVQPVVVPEEGAWSPEAPSEVTSLWVYGSVINYVFGLGDTVENRELLERLVLGDEIVLTTRSGSSSTFAISGRTEVSSDNRDIFAQRTPGVTLVLVEENLDEQRLVVQGQYVLSDAKTETAAGRVVELGETAQLEGLQVTVTAVSYQFDRPDAPQGFAYYLVDLELQNVGTVEVNTGSISIVLADDLGNLYALNPAASQVGNFRVLTGFIEPGQTVQASAGFQIPVDLASPVLHLQLTRIETGSQIQVNIPFQESGAAGDQAAIQLQDAQVSEDGTSLVIAGQITNLGEQALPVDVNNVTLSGDGTVYLMLSTNPAFTWTIGAGQTLLFQVTFQRPVSDNAVFTVLNQSFQLTGLR